MNSWIFPAQLRKVPTVLAPVATPEVPHSGPDRRTQDPASFQGHSPKNPQATCPIRQQNFSAGKLVSFAGTEKFLFELLRIPQ